MKNDLVRNLTVANSIFKNLLELNEILSWKELVQKYGSPSIVQYEILKIAVAEGFSSDAKTEKEYLSAFYGYATKKMIEIFGPPKEEQCLTGEEDGFDLCCEKALDVQNSILEFFKVMAACDLLSDIQIKENRIIFSNKNDFVHFQHVFKAMKLDFAFHLLPYDQFCINFEHSDRLRHKNAEKPEIVIHYVEDISEPLTCDCGNTPESNGFPTCDEYGTEMEPAIDSDWDGTYLCNRCGKIHKVCETDSKKEEF